MRKAAPTSDTILDRPEICVRRTPNLGHSDSEPKTWCGKFRIRNWKAKVLILLVAGEGAATTSIPSRKASEFNDLIAMEVRI